MRNFPIDIGQLVLQKLKENDKTVVWLAKQIGCDDSNLGKTLRNSRYIYFDLLLRISVAMEEDFFAYYSQKLNETSSGKNHR